MIETSQQFKEARHKLGLSVGEAAKLLRVNPRTIRRWETGLGHGDGRNPHPSACVVLEGLLKPPKLPQHSD